MNIWLKIFIFIIPICGIIMVGIGIKLYLSGDLSRDYYMILLLFFLMGFSYLGMFGLFVKNKKK